MAYLAAFLMCVCLSVVSTWYVRKIANARGWIHEPKLDRHLHTIPVPRLGGVAIYVSFMSVVILAMALPHFFGTVAPLHAKAMIGLMGPALIVFLLGLYDDLYSLNAYWKFGIETIAAILLYAGGYGISNLGLIHRGQALDWIYGLPLTVLWVLLITNAFNLIDGLDGLAAGSAVFSTMVVFVTSLIVPNLLVAFLAIALAGATLGFLRFNFHPASIFLGDSGSLFIGFMLATLALAGSEKAPTIVAVAIPIVSLGLPILDVVLAVVRRFLAGKRLFEGDKHHIHHKLMKLGLSQREAVLILYAVTAGFGFLSLVLMEGRATIALVLAVMGIGVFIGVQQLRYQEFAEILSAIQRVTRRRQILANHVAIRHVAESLNECHEFRSICDVLKQTLQPIGFDGIKLQMLNPNGFAPSSFQPLVFAGDGNLLFNWSDGHRDEPAWELRLELLTSSDNKWGYVTLIRMRDEETLPLDVNVLTTEFRTSLSDAVHRACARLEAAMKAQKGVREVQTHKLAAGSMSD